MAEIMCPFCGNSNVFAFKDTNFMRCEKCQLFINKNFPTKQKLKERNRAQLLGACRNEKKRKGRFVDANEQLDKLEQYIPPGRVYDVGAASGFFMKAAIDRGWIVHGNEISKKAISWAKSQFNIDIEYGFLEELAMNIDYYDAIVLWNILEHTYNPKITLSTCQTMLKKNGLIFIRVPNKMTADDLKQYYTDWHLFEFTTACLSRHLGSLGFQEIEKRISHNPKTGVPHADYLYKNMGKL